MEGGGGWPKCDNSTNRLREWDSEKGGSQCEKFARRHLWMVPSRKQPLIFLLLYDDSALMQTLIEMKLLLKLHYWLTLQASQCDKTLIK